MIIKIPLFDKKTLPFDAITLFFVVFIFVRNPSRRLIKHELVHVHQWKKDPFLFHLKYIAEFVSNLVRTRSWMKAYREISYEIEARTKAG